MFYGFFKTGDSTASYLCPIPSHANMSILGHLPAICGMIRINYAQVFVKALILARLNPVEVRSNGQGKVGPCSGGAKEQQTTFLPAPRLWFSFIAFSCQCILCWHEQLILYSSCKLYTFKLPYWHWHDLIGVSKTVVSDSVSFASNALLSLFLVERTIIPQLKYSNTRARIARRWSIAYIPRHPLCSFVPAFVDLLKGFCPVCLDLSNPLTRLTFDTRGRQWYVGGTGCFVPNIFH